MQSIEHVASLRAQLWDAGFRPVPVLTDEKVPLGRDWGNCARKDPPDGVRFPPVAHALNSGILCDGLRAIDLDIDDPAIATRCRAIAVDRFGEAPIRMRRNSSRCLILYRATEGAPSKLSIAGEAGKIEVLGKGQQFVAFGRHPSGADLEWFPDAPGHERLEAIPAVTEADVLAYLETVAPLIGAPPPARTNGHDHTPGEPQADPLRIAAALAAIPNAGHADWEAWNRVGMAIWRATGGSSAGWEAWNAWSQRNATYDATETRARWDHYFTSPPTEIGAGTIFHLARQASQEPPPTEPVREPDGAEPLSPLPLLWYRDVTPMLDARDFVQGVLMEQSAAVVYGRSNSGKTFWVTDLALHVSAGLEWNGRRVDHGGVAYCVLEGGIGFRNRVSAWKDERGLGGYDLPFVAIPCALNLLKPDGDTDRLVQSVQFAKSQIDVPLKLIVIDTLARALAGGNENAPDDMGLLVANMDVIREKTGAAVLFVHHSGKDEAKGARGHSSLQAAIDTEIEVIDTEMGGVRTATVVKQRELRKGDTFEFSLRVVELGQNRHAETVTTCIVDYGDSAARGRGLAAGAATARRHLKGHNKRALEVLMDLVATSGQAGYAGVPSGVNSVPEKWWRERFYERAMPGDSDEAKQAAFRRATKALLNEHIAGMANRRVWIVSKHEQPTNGTTEMPTNTT